jgi:hypothetical protein
VAGERGPGKLRLPAMDSAQAKRDFAIALLQESSLFIHLDPRREGATVPSWLKRQPQLVLQVGLNMAVRIPDLDVGEQAICCTLSFNRSPFFCYIPWSAIFGLVGEDGRGRIWPEDVPIEIASQMQKDASKEPAKGNAKSQRLAAARARLQAVPASGQAAKDAKDEPLPSAPRAEVSPIRSDAIKPAPEMSSTSEPDTSERRGGSPPPGNSKKRELPAYLRVVK